MSLPEELEKGLWTEIQKFEEETKMEYVSSVERIGMQKGREEGIQQGIQQGSLSLLCRQIAKRFKTGYEFVAPLFTDLRSEDIEDLGERFLDAESLDDIRKWTEEKRLQRMQ